MRSSHILDREAALQRWWQESLGAALLGAESELLGEALEDVFGWELLQVGAWGGTRWPPQAPFTSPRCRGL